MADIAKLCRHAHAGHSLVHRLKGLRLYRRSYNSISYGGNQFQKSTIDLQLHGHRSAASAIYIGAGNAVPSRLSTDLRGPSGQAGTVPLTQQSRQNRPGPGEICGLPPRRSGRASRPRPRRPRLFRSDLGTGHGLARMG